MNHFATLAMMGIRSVLDGGKLFCGVSEEQFAINGVTYQWPRGSRITWGVDFSRLGTLSDMDCKDCFTAALQEISRCCDVSHAYVANARSANLLISTRRLDGAMGVLADCQIPVGNVTPDTQLLMRLDDSEGWVISESPGPAQIDLYRVFLHEAEHGHGLGHKPANIVEPASSPQSTAVRFAVSSRRTPGSWSDGTVSPRPHRRPPRRRRRSR